MTTHVRKQFPIDATQVFDTDEWWDGTHPEWFTNAVTIGNIWRNEDGGVGALTEYGAHIAYHPDYIALNETTNQLFVVRESVLAEQYNTVD